jgi:hypothetical protein
VDEENKIVIIDEFTGRRMNVPELLPTVQEADTPESTEPRFLADHAETIEKVGQFCVFLPVLALYALCKGRSGGTTLGS